MSCYLYTSEVHTLLRNSDVLPHLQVQGEVGVPGKQSGDSGYLVRLPVQHGVVEKLIKIFILLSGLVSVGTAHTMVEYFNNLSRGSEIRHYNQCVLGIKFS